MYALNPPSAVPMLKCIYVYAQQQTTPGVAQLAAPAAFIYVCGQD